MPFTRAGGLAAAGFILAKPPRRIVRDWLQTKLGDERLLRHDWITGETLFLRQLAFRELEQAGR